MTNPRLANNVKIQSAAIVLEQGVRHGEIAPEAYINFMNGLIAPEQFLFMGNKIYTQDPGLQNKLATTSPEAFAAKLNTSGFPESLQAAAMMALSQEIPVAQEKPSVSSFQR